ncbi:MAG: hypothetical protein ACLFWD_07985 [Anaerolineales bacterium]
MTVTRSRKGKYFTDVIRKRPIRARLRTREDLIEGTIHVHPDRRPLDELNETKGFVAVTNAIIKSGGEEIKADFLAINLDQILWVQPLENKGVDRD